MATRCWLATALSVFGLVILSLPQLLAADEPADALRSPVYSGLVPDDAFAALVLYPKRVLSNEALAKFDIKSLASDFAGHAGFSPVDLEQVTILLGPSISGGAGQKGQPKVAIIGRFSAAQNGEELAQKWLRGSKTEQITVAGHACFRPKKEPNGFQPLDVPNICFLDSRTFIMASELWMPDVLGAKNSKSQLISNLSGVGAGVDVSLLFVNTDAAKEFVAGLNLAKSFPGPFKPIADLPSLLAEGGFGLLTQPNIRIRLLLVGNDQASAEKIEETIKSLQQLGQSFLPALQVPPDEKMPAEQRESREYAASLAAKIINGLIPRRSGKQVTVDLKDLGTVDGLVGKLLLPAIKSTQQAAERTRESNNLRQLALAMMQIEQVDGHLPAHAICSKDGKPLLSWRVHVLPYLEEETLYRQFHLDEPWDSDNNKPLIAKMPAVFKTLNSKPLAEGLTRYVVPFGKDTIFEGNKGTAISKITDGTSNTILILEVGEDKAVTWTKPDDMDFDPQKPKSGLGTIGEKFHAAFADGSVHLLSKDIDAETFRRLILRNDGQPIDQSKF